MIRLSQICCTPLRMELPKFNVNNIANIPQRHFILTLYISAFPISFIKDFNSADDGVYLCKS